MPKETSSDSLRRITISMPESTFRALDRIVTERGFDSRSQGIAEMIHQQAAEHLGKIGSQVMVGTLTMIYDESKS
jgi:CopG family transcriptional regulator, nickel-responsive regulator